MRRNTPYFLFILVMIALDQAAKFVISRTVELYESRAVIPGFFSITRIHNRGAIFGAFNQSNNQVVFIALTAASLLALGLVVFYFFKTPPSDRLMKISLALIMAGAFGAMMISGNSMLQEFGFALTVAVLLDAMVVRTYIVPAALTLMGDKAWWAPSWLQREGRKEKAAKKE